MAKRPSLGIGARDSSGPRVNIQMTIFWSIFTRPKGMPAEIRTLFEELIKEHLEMMDKVHSSWQSHHQPTWKDEIKASSDMWAFRWFTKSKVMVYLAEGTKIRWAIMDRSFRRRTRVRKFGAFGEGGEPLRRGKKAVGRPRKGIQARAWHYEIAKLESRPRAGWSPRVQKAIAIWAKREFEQGGKKVKVHRIKVNV